MRLLKTIVIKGKIICLEGLLIGGSKSGIGIGETDNPLIKHPINKQPYIPGSSIKGKLRFTLEKTECEKEGDEHFKYTNKYGRTSHVPCWKKSCPVCRLFGSGQPDQSKQPTRLLFCDAYLTDNWKEKWESSFLEIKTEVQIDRQYRDGKVSKMGPRDTERIPEGTEFKFELFLRVFENDDIKKHLLFIARGLDLMETEKLGGYGSRGYGRVKFTTEDGKMLLAEYVRKMAENETL